MRICFIKTSHQEYTLECVRDDGSVTKALLEAKSYLKHDMVHALYEREAGLRASFYGTINSGRALEDMTPKAMRENAEGFAGGNTEAQTTEIVVGSLQGALSKEALPADFASRTGEYLALQGLAVPTHLSQEFLEQVFQKVSGLLRQYAALKTGERLCVDMSM